MQQHACSDASIIDYVILSPECFPLIKKSEVQKFELVLSGKYSPVCFTLVAEDERKKHEVEFEADYVSDSFMDENTESAVHYSKPKWN